MPRRPAVEKKKIGRRTLLTEDRADTIIAAVKKGNHLTVACALGGIAYPTLWNWLDKADRVAAAIDNGNPYHPDDLIFLDFRDRLTHARAEAEARVVGAVVSDIQGGRLASREPVMQTVNNNTTVARDDAGEILFRESWTTPNGRVGLAFLARSAPHRWGEKSRTEAEPDGDPLLGGTLPVAAGDDVEDQPDVTALVERLALVARERREGVDLVEEPTEDEDADDEAVDVEFTEDEEDPL